MGPYVFVLRRHASGTGGTVGKIRDSNERKDKFRLCRRRWIGAGQFDQTCKLKPSLFARLAQHGFTGRLPRINAPRNGLQRPRLRIPTPIDAHAKLFDQQYSVTNRIIGQHRGRIA